MATPKEQHDARQLAREGKLPVPGRDERVDGPVRPAAGQAPPRAEAQGDGEPENELELRDHSGDPTSAG